jgi:acetyl-CoA C-acetyltransferase
MASKGFFNAFNDVVILDGVRTPQVDYQGAFADANPIDLGIKVARTVLQRTGISAIEVDSVIAGSMAPVGFDQFYLPRHIGLYSGVPTEVPALMVQRICGTGFELFRQADYMWEALTDPATAVSMIQTAENLAKKYGITREDVDAFAASSFARAVAAQEAGWFEGEIVPVGNENFELDGYKASPRPALAAARASRC